MEPPVAFAPVVEQTSQISFFGKLGSYFDRPEWWEEGAATLNAFFGSTEPPANELDQRLEDLLDLLEPLKVAENPQQSNDPEKIGLRKETHVAAAPAIENNLQDPLHSPENHNLVKSISAVDVNSVTDAISTSSPGLTGTTTTRQTSPLPKSSTRASSTTPDAGSLLEDGVPAPFPLEAPKPRSSLDSITVRHEDHTTYVESGRADNVALTDPLDAIGDDPVSIPPARCQSPVSDEHANSLAGIRSGSEDDPTGLQAVKDEVSEEYGLTTTIDSSILTQETDITVVHDSSLAAVSFFPPNPYSDEPHEFNFDASENSLVVSDGQVGDNNHEYNEELSADSTLSSLASNTARLPEDYLEQLNDLERWRFKTPSPPPLSPLSPPSLSSIGTRHVDQDAMAGADVKDGADATPSSIPPTAAEPTAEFDKACPSRSRNTKGLKIITRVMDGLGESTVTEETKMPSASITTRKAKRKPEEPHPDVPSQKRSLRSRPRNEDKSTSNAKSMIEHEDDATKDKSKTIQRGKSKAASRSTQRNSPDELAPASPDELADPPAPNSFVLNKVPSSLAKPKLDRSTSKRLRTAKPLDTTAPLRKLVGVARATRAAVGNKELTGLLGASPPHKVEEKADADISGRLRSQVRTPAPSPAPTPDPMPVLAPSSISTSITKSADVLANETTDTSAKDTPPPAKRTRLPGANPLGALELKELGSPPILETRTRARTSTAETTLPASDAQTTAKSAPKRAKPNVSLAASEPAQVGGNQDIEVNPTPVPPLILSSTPAPAPALVPTSTTEDTDTVSTETTGTVDTNAPSPTKRKRLTGANPLGALELKELGSFPVLETRTRSRTATVEPTPEPASVVTSGSAPKPTSDTIAKPTPAKRIRKPVIRSITRPATSSPFALTAKSKGTPAASKKKASVRQKAAEADKDDGALTAKSTTTMTKRKRGEDAEEIEKEPTRTSKRIAGAQPDVN